MGLIYAVGRQAKIIYGTRAQYFFTVGTQTNTVIGTSPQYINGALSPSGLSVNNYPIAGTFTIAGSNVVVTAADATSGEGGVANRIINSSISGWNMHQGLQDANVITMTSSSVGSVSAPVIAGAGALGIIISNVQFINGTAIPTAGAQDDIRISGKYPMTIKVIYTGGTLPDVQVSYGTDEDQSRGVLTYESALVLTNQSISLASPANFIRLTTKSSNTQAVLYLND
jgi:hypothetical protein